MDLLQTDTTLPYGFNSIHEKHSNPEPIYNILENFQIAFLMILRKFANNKEWILQEKYYNRLSFRIIQCYGNAKLYLGLLSCWQLRIDGFDSK